MGTMTAPLTVLAFLLAGAVATLLWYRERARTRAAVRLGGLIGVEVDGPAVPDVAREQPLRTFPPRYRIAVFVGGLLVAVVVRFVGGPTEVAGALGCLIGVLAYLAEEYIAEQRIARIETQLSDAIDLLVGALRAGSALLAGLEASLRESRPPIRPYLQDIVGRIRLGDDPREVLTELPQKVPFETFRLFSTALAVHWEVGGSLASTLATVGRTIRDRIELSRRVRAQGVEAHVSVGSVMIIAYALGFLMWRTNPDRIEAFMRSGVGTELVSGVIVLQAIGLVWMSRISRSDF
jgi:tight adherence protein B